MNNITKSKNIWQWVSLKILQGMTLFLNCPERAIPERSLKVMLYENIRKDDF